MAVPIAEGEVLAGKYRVERVLGAGGMGVVVAAYHLQLEQRVALKFLLPQGQQSAEAIARFKREARAAVRIKSEHVARVLDVGELDTGAPYMVMEYLDGADLSVWLKDKGPLRIDLAVEFVLQASEAIAEAHAQGIIHRDLKPANLFCVRRSDGALSIKVLDFGISKLKDNDHHSLTKTHGLIGTPAYMSPEQLVSSKQVDARADIWSLGVILYELVSGELPFDGDSLTAMVLQIASGQPRPLREHCHHAPEALWAVIERCFEKEPGRRYSNVAELALALAPFGPERSRLSVERIGRLLRPAGAGATQLAASGSQVGATLPLTLDDLAGSDPGQEQAVVPTMPWDGARATGERLSTQQNWGGTAAMARAPAVSRPRGAMKAAVIGVFIVLGVGLAGALALTWGRWGDPGAAPVAGEPPLLSAPHTGAAPEASPSAPAAAAAPAVIITPAADPSSEPATPDGVVQAPALKTAPQAKTPAERPRVSPAPAPRAPASKGASGPAPAPTPYDPFKHL